MLNKAILMGRLVADPELRRTSTDKSVVTFTLAVNRNFARQGEQAQTDFIDIVAWGKTAEFVSRYFVKGQLVAVAGQIQTRTWEDKQGNKRKSVEVVAEEVHFAEPKRDSQPRNDAPRGGFDPMAGLGGNAFAALPGDDNDLPF
ncbi:MAG: single-stranded DNA-binding protein [Clostridia bacterium]|nr:single-stranded DNA-binding protein [Clostridia bacterium]